MLKRFRTWVIGVYTHMPQPTELGSFSCFIIYAD
jgi:hypothetical protein